MCPRGGEGLTLEVCLPRASPSLAKVTEEGTALYYSNVWAWKVNFPVGQESHSSWVCLSGKGEVLEKHFTMTFISMWISTFTEPHIWASTIIHFPPFGAKLQNLLSGDRIVFNWGLRVREPLIGLLAPGQEGVFLGRPTLSTQVRTDRSAGHTLAFLLLGPQKIHFVRK